MCSEYNSTTERLHRILNHLQNAEAHISVGLQIIAECKKTPEEKPTSRAAASVAPGSSSTEEKSQELILHTESNTTERYRDPLSLAASSVTVHISLVPYRIVCSKNDGDHHGIGFRQSQTTPDPGTGTQITPASSTSTVPEMNVQTTNGTSGDGKNTGTRKKGKGWKRRRGARASPESGKEADSVLQESPPKRKYTLRKVKRVDYKELPAPKP